MTINALFVLCLDSPFVSYSHLRFPILMFVKSSIKKFQPLTGIKPKTNTNLNARLLNSWESWDAKVELAVKVNGNPLPSPDCIDE